MSKEAVTSHQLNPLLLKRWSPRAFSDKQVEEEKLVRVLEAARWAPSASNIQPWMFFPGLKGDEVYGMIFQTLVEFNQLWCKHAPVLILNCAKTTNDKGKQNGTWQYDLGQAVAHLSIQAMDDELYVHQMSGFDAKKAGELFELPPDVKAVSVSALGYIGDPGILHPRMQKSERAVRERKDLDTFVFSEKFGEISSLVESDS
jgi:hypothetical protein